ncbi:hypothetical protein B0H17DRAFT_1126602 [Mycena rosella]|uniref:Uncharacterized protein n=1 Tax=Mycena rosella TaxID=1033263 RepID=A0AAD7GTL3_MYCRO|nr:hypothetical protein B0H17DRAFT_1126602 [Mycena rosella]
MLRNLVESALGACCSVVLGTCSVLGSYCTSLDITRAILMCLLYLVQQLPKAEGHINVRMVLLMGVLPMLLRAVPWLPACVPEYRYENTKIEELGLVDCMHPFGKLYTELMHLVTDCLAMVHPKDGKHIDLSDRCNKCGHELAMMSSELILVYAQCNKHDMESTFKYQKADWIKHEQECKVQEFCGEQAIFIGGKARPMLPEDSAYLFQTCKAYFLSASKHCLGTLPVNTTNTKVFITDMGTMIDMAWYFNARWRKAMCNEHTLMYILISEEFCGGKGMVLEKLIKMVKGEFEYGRFSRHILFAIK